MNYLAGGEGAKNYGDAKNIILGATRYYWWEEFN